MVLLPFDGAYVLLSEEKDILRLWLVRYFILQSEVFFFSGVRQSLLP